MDSKIKNIFGDIKRKLESSLPFIKSEISELNKPSIAGNKGFSYNLETENEGIVIFFWETGVFEITTDLIISEDGNNFFSSYVPGDYQNEMYPQHSVDLFVERINELFSLLKIEGKL